MIFVTVGTHTDQFTRLIRHMDEIAPMLNEKVVIQRGFTKYLPKNAESFEWSQDLEKYFSEARIVITHAATSVIEFVKKHKKPVIMVPRQAGHGEHINDHQVEFAEFFERSAGAKCILDIGELSSDFIKSYKDVPVIKEDNLARLRMSLRGIFERFDKTISL